MHLILLIEDAWHATRWKDKLTIWFRPLGWRPADVARRYPVYKIDDVYALQKFDAGGAPKMIVWSFLQMVTVLLSITWLFANISAIGAPGIFYYGAWVFISVYAYTELMDMNRNAFYWELLRSCFGAGLVLATDGWFGVERYIPAIQFILFTWFLISAAFVYFLSRSLPFTGFQKA